MKKGECIRFHRLAYGMKQAELAKKVGYKSFQAIALIERGERNLRDEKLLKIAEVFGSRPEYIFNGKVDTDVALKLLRRMGKAYPLYCDLIEKWIIDNEI